MTRLKNLFAYLLISSLFYAFPSLAQPDLNSPEFRIAVFQGWAQPMEPFRLVGNVYYVGTTNIGSLLITTPEGHILLDPGTNLMQASLMPNIQQLGFDPRDIKVLLNTHAHVDHIEGMAHMKRQTGAAVAIMEADVEAAETGKDMSFINYAGWEPVKVDRVLKTGDTVNLGGMTLHAIWTPGHTPGTTAWIFDVEENGQTYTIAVGGPPTPVLGNPKYDTRHADAMAAFENLRRYEVNMQISMHPMGFAQNIDALRRGARPHPLLQSAEVWRNQINQAEAAYLQRREELGY